MSATIEHLARRAADARKSLISLHTGPSALGVAFDLMNVNPRRATPGEQTFAATVAASQVDFLRRADVILADADMCTLIDVAVPTMPDQVLRDDDLISPHGFVMFADPVPDRTMVGATPPIQALSWSYVPDGHPLLPNHALPDVTASVLIMTYVLTSDLYAATGQTWEANAPRYMPVSTTMWQVGSEIGQVYGGEVSYDDADPAFISGSPPRSGP